MEFWQIQKEPLGKSEMSVRAVRLLHIWVGIVSAWKSCGYIIYMTVGLDMCERMIQLEPAGSW